jgi:hypothetical protein
MLASGVLHCLTGFENNQQYGTGWRFNFILCNGDRSKQRDKKMTYYTHMMPEGSHKLIRSVTIHHYSGCIIGFSFFDKERALLWKIGDTIKRWLKKDIVLIGENERIIGVVAKLFPGYQSRYSDFQF